jgi:hypothetical protein
MEIVSCFSAQARRENSRPGWRVSAGWHPENIVSRHARLLQL